MLSLSFVLKGIILKISFPNDVNETITAEIMDYFDEVSVVRVPIDIKENEPLLLKGYYLKHVSTV